MWPCRDSAEGMRDYGRDTTLRNIVEFIVKTHLKFHKSSGPILGLNDINKQTNEKKETEQREGKTKGPDGCFGLWSGMVP